MTSFSWRRALLAFAALAGFLGMIAPAAAQGDLLVAPTRLILDGRRSTEVVLNNIGSTTATYRISLEIRRMTAEGRLETVEPEAYNAGERAIQDMLIFSPRRVTLTPNQPQIVRVAVRFPEGIADGEYRAHMLFRAIPNANPVAPEGNAVQVQNRSVGIALVPIYGVTIPVIVRRGALAATASLANPRVELDSPDRPVFRVEINRQGTRSVYGEVIVSVPGRTEPVIVARGVGVYPEINQRTLSLAITAEQAAALRGQAVSIRYVEDRDLGSATIAELNGARM